MWLTKHDQARDTEVRVLQLVAEEDFVVMGTSGRPSQVTRDSRSLHNYLCVSMYGGWEGSAVKRSGK